MVLCQLLNIFLPDVPHSTTARSRGSQAHLYFAFPRAVDWQAPHHSNHLALGDFLSCALPLSLASTAEQFDMSGLEVTKDWEESLCLSGLGPKSMDPAS